MIKVGRKYQTRPKFDKTHTVHIFYKSICGERPYFGLRDDGVVIEFNSFGFDEWYECGGYWNALDLKTEEPSSVKLIYDELEEKGK